MNLETSAYNGGLTKRVSGVLLHPTSFPSPYGIGDLGRCAYEFIDFLHKAGQHLWQVLPLTNTGYGDSPYQSFSAFAGQPLLISPDDLTGLGLADPEDLTALRTDNVSHVDYGTLIPLKTALLQKAYDGFLSGHNTSLKEDYDSFCLEQSFWLDDYALFMACKDRHGGSSFSEWEEPYRNPSPAVKEQLYEEFAQQSGYYKFTQFLFFREWNALKTYANERGIEIIGDIPIFVSMDSADVWANQHLFKLDQDGRPLAVAGVPPDYFSATGQLWGNPLYDWEQHKKEGYAWWISRIQSQLSSFDYLRIDHFRGFDAYWSVPYGEETAVNGKWEPGPKEDFFGAVTQAFCEPLPIIAEDLGVITPEVEALRDQFCFPGMKVLQFAFESTGESSFLPHQYTTTNCVCYTGTHDNDTTAGWFETLREDCREKVLRYMHTNGEQISMDFIRTCLSSIASFAVFPLQDLLCIGKEGRMNTPGITGGNWAWRYKESDLCDELAQILREMTHLYGRY